MRYKALTLAICSLFLFDGKVKTEKSEKLVDSVWRGDATCGGLRAEIWSDAKGWHEADCMEIARKLSKLRDVRQVMVTTGPDIPGMLAFVQYENEFRIKLADFAAAQKECQRILEEGYAHPDIISHCKTVVSGTIPYGLKLKP